MFSILLKMIYSHLSKDCNIPKEFLFLTENCQLCFLTTCRDNIPDIHTMFFTYHKEDKVILLTTDKGKKY